MTDTTDYYSHVREDFFHEISKGNNTILEFGCSEGRTGQAIKKAGLADYYVGVDIHEPSVKVASTFLDEAICANLDDFDFSKLGNKKFDYVICGDVLEHLYDPWKALSEIHGLIKPGGKLIITLPNTRHYSVSASLLFKGTWTYSEAGILDRTHIRFFTKSTIMSLFSSEMYELKGIEPLFWGRRDALINKVTLSVFVGILAPQWLFVLTKR